ncbi:MAG: hypothetical protein GY931_00445 [Maribacter sp.]|nr:hypothetical protein [Maribacter sp.]
MKSKCGKFTLLDDDAKKVADGLLGKIAKLENADPTPDSQHWGNSIKPFKIEYFRINGFLNKRPNIARVYIDLPIIEAKKLLNKLNKEIT